MRLALLLLPLLLLARLSATDRAAPDGPTWLGDADEAFARAAESGRPLLIVFR